MTPIDIIRRVLFLPDGASTVATEIDLLHATVVSTAMIGAFAVAVVTANHVLRYRRSSDDQPTERIVNSRALTIAKVVGPLSLFLAFLSFGFRQYVEVRTPPRDALDVYVTGKQWMWKFAYPSGASSIATLVVPKGRAIRLVMTARDVIHSFYVPAFRVKQDVVPGHTTMLWFEANRTGEFEILCAEYCGTSHSGMRGAVRVLEQADFDRWLADQAAPHTMAARGAEIARQKQCLACHVDNHLGPSFAGLYGSNVKLANGSTIVADEAYITRSILAPAAELRAGYPASMPTYQGQLGVDDIAALVEYIKGAK